jgi:predicted AAA+ superfamily ATPase
LNKELADLIARAEGVLARVESLLPEPTPDPDWKRITAARWRKRSGRGYLQSIAHPHAIELDELVAVEDQKRVIDQNTRQFVAGFPANNVLLTGSRGTGKSSLVKAMLAKYAGKGLRLIEVDKGDLVDLPDIAERVAQAPYRFLIFCDDLTFDAGEAGYKALKVMLDGSIAGAAGNVVVYATSNRRHLLPEYFIENLETKHVGEEVHPGESVEEKISLSERFGLWISFYPFRKTTISRPPPRGSRTSASSPRRARRKRKLARAKHCNGRCSADRAAAAPRGSSRRTTRARTAL